MFFNSFYNIIEEKSGSSSVGQSESFPNSRSPVRSGSTAPFNATSH